ncbi:hypothetical protein [Kineococcus sp. SYSU DK018]|uniref:hypothetical protein n=1 Tax=Kineococcus sp. SYSU DK018 TaxID=3383139 RepID=UPI003D7F092F
MPLVEISHSRDALGEKQLDALADRLSAIALAAEGLPDTPTSRPLAVVTTRAWDGVHVGGRPSGEPRIDVVLHTLPGVLDEPARAAVLAELTSAVVEEVDGMDARGGGRVWCRVHETLPSGFSVAGRVMSPPLVRQLAGCADVDGRGR